MACAPDVAAPAGRRGRALLLWLLSLGWAAFLAPGATAITDRPAAIVGDEPITPVPLSTPVDPDKARLGGKLFHDTRLSRGDRVSCASCHDLEAGGHDGLARPPGPDGRPLDFNTPTVFNAALNFRLNWRGNFRGLEEHAEAVILDSDLMGATWGEVIGKLRADPDYRRAFAAIYGDEPAPAHVVDALAAFERSLLTPNARFDRYLRGQRNAITPEEKRGYELFKTYGCIACHQGVNVGGNLFQRFGVFYDPFAQGPVTAADLGRVTVTGEASDRHVFRVPSLRNVGVTAPYFHDGRARRLERAIEEMARSQLGRTLTRQEIGLIAKFLHTLTGEYRGRPLSDRPPSDQGGERP